ncbi:Dam family site-specific DNA-(adenine-N6)-methyltransferase [Salmonella enterica subsp. enterica]|nr:Dam family site-specific DNA-(adenine-N6)-methyltransferase [Salmonella enterica]EDB5719421.1 Dam family site-specific DNA-(adenine-N6)-methyltransferase [Salmonella enterica subsp. enterica serovar Rubislaw]EDS2442225.1 Dam family site-specific DNA-(adenine-N6)-methyltransferase [Salmonella enterica subsp. enterica]EDT8774280.1 Dam family site-specific DNA-(adenine-N6)-methyltransferase [Salmonella enterica subsp. enterica serovar Panama]EEA7829854.1 Dam family site-specific DNA-(adenine-N6
MKKPVFIRSPLKWAGGKYNALPELFKHLPREGECLIEPFVGSGTIFLNTNYRRYVLCDSNPALINFFHTLTWHTGEVIWWAGALFSVGDDKEDYYSRRKFYNTIKDYPRLVSDRVYWAALFLYLNRHSFNGLFRTNSKGEFNVPFGKREKAPYFPEKEMRRFALKARQTKTKFICCDFRLALNPYLVPELDNAVIYCDPPYIPESKTADFTQYNGERFTRRDHEHLIKYLTNNKLHFAKVVISNSDTPLTREIYAPFNLHKLKVRRSISANAKGRKNTPEVIGVLDGRERYVSAPRRAGKATVMAQWRDTSC